MFKRLKDLIKTALEVEIIPETKDKQEKRQPLVTGRYFFIRHDRPVYSKELMEVLESMGYSFKKDDQNNDYPGASFEDQNLDELNLDLRFHPKPEEQIKLENSGVSIGWKYHKVDVGATHERQTIERAKYDGTIKSPENRQNLSTIADPLRDDLSKLYIFTGPRTRHGLTAEAVLKDLQKVINVDPELVMVMGDLVDLKKHWGELFEQAKELNEEIEIVSKLDLALDTNQKNSLLRYFGELKNRGIKIGPWSQTFSTDPKMREYLKLLGREAFNPDIIIRSRKYLNYLSCFFNNTNDKIPIVLNFTSDLILKAVLGSLGIESVNGKELVNEFWPEPGSFIQIVTLNDGSADIYYQALDQASPQFICNIGDYLAKLKLETKNDAVI